MKNAIAFVLVDFETFRSTQKSANEPGVPEGTEILHRVLPGIYLILIKATKLTWNDYTHSTHLKETWKTFGIVDKMTISL